MTTAVTAITVLETSAFHPLLASLGAWFWGAERVPPRGGAQASDRHACDTAHAAP